VKTLLKILPKKQDFFELFESAARNLYDGAKLQRDLMEDYKDAEEKRKRIFDIENEGDLITHETIKRLNKTFVTPIDREDIHALICRMDDILDLIEGTADRMQVFKVKEPTMEAVVLSRIIFSTTEAISKAISYLKEKNYSYINEYCIKINQLENEGDRVYRDAVGKLFENEKDPMMVIKWREIYKNMEDALDRCEDVANILEGIVLKHA